jgi:hypothetical protein
MNSPTFLTEVAGIISIVVSRVTSQVGVVIKCTLEDRQELVTCYIRVVRTLAA